jgi:hypothetical protein
MSVPTAISEMSPQIICLKGRKICGAPAEFWPPRLFAFELRRCGDAGSGKWYLDRTGDSDMNRPKQGGFQSDGSVTDLPQRRRLACGVAGQSITPSVRGWAWTATLPSASPSHP